MSPLQELDRRRATTGPCALERNLGEGTFQAVRGHGGITARVLQSGIIRLDDSLAVEPVPASGYATFNAG